MNTWRRRRSSGWPRLLVGWLARGLALARVAVEVAAQALRGHRARRANAGRGGRGERGGGRRRRVRRRRERRREERRQAPAGRGERQAQERGRRRGGRRLGRRRLSAERHAPERRGRGDAARRRAERGPAYLYLVLRSNDLDAFYCTPPEQRKDPSKPGGDASDERKRAILFRSGRARRKLATILVVPSRPRGTTRHPTARRRGDATRRRSSQKARKRREISLHR